MLTHNVWVSGWPVIITLLGRLMIVRGALRIMIAKQVATLSTRMMAQWPNILFYSGLLVITLGAFLCWKGFP